MTENINEFNCNGCGGTFTDLAGILGYTDLDVRKGSFETVAYMQYAKTLCPRCQHVMKDILMSSDLSEQWDEYEWSLVGDAYNEPYNND